MLLSYSNNHHTASTTAAAASGALCQEQAVSLARQSLWRRLHHVDVGVPVAGSCDEASRGGYA